MGGGRERGARREASRTQRRSARLFAAVDDSRGEPACHRTGRRLTLLLYPGQVNASGFPLAVPDQPRCHSPCPVPDNAFGVVPSLLPRAWTPFARSDSEHGSEPSYGGLERASPAPNPRPGKAATTGRVDGGTVSSCHRRPITLESITGVPPTDPEPNFHASCAKRGRHRLRCCVG